MNWELKVAAMAVLMAKCALAERHEAMAIKVVIFDYVGASAHTLGAGKAVASGILKRAGIRVDWAECAGRIEPGKDIPCPQMMPLDIELRIQNNAAAHHAGFNRRCLGYAVTAGGFGSIASVFYDRAGQVAQDEARATGDVLGAAVAHEIGHLLLANRGHAPVGLMRAAWDAADLRALAQGRLTFSASQSRRLIEAVEGRSRERTRVLAVR